MRDCTHVPLYSQGDMKLLKYPGGSVVQVRDEDAEAQVQRIKRDHNITVTVVDAPAKAELKPETEVTKKPAKAGK